MSAGNLHQSMLWGGDESGGELDYWDHTTERFAYSNDEKNSWSPDLKTTTSYLSTKPYQDSAWYEAKHPGDPSNITDLSSCVSFTVFLKLPKEIQIKIWKHAADLPRSIIIYYELFHRGEQLSQALKIFTRVPAILYACTLSRIVGLKIFDVLTKQELNGCSIYVNWKVDTLVFTSLSAIYSFLEIINLAEEFRNFTPGTGYGPFIRNFSPFGAERLAIADDDEAIRQMTIENLVTPTPEKKVPLNEKIKSIVLALTDIRDVFSIKKFILQCENLESFKFLIMRIHYEFRQQEMEDLIKPLIRDFAWSYNKEESLVVEMFSKKELNKFLTDERF